MSHFNEAFEVNTTACFYTLIAFLKLLDYGNKSEPGQRIGVKSQFIVTGSIGAFSRRPGMGFAYSGSKVATIHIVKQLATMLADWRIDIRVNCFCPGVYPSDMSKVCKIFQPAILISNFLPGSGEERNSR